jgi:hypothetical protein
MLVAGDKVHAAPPCLSACLERLTARLKRTERSGCALQFSGNSFFPSRRRLRADENHIGPHSWYGTQITSIAVIFPCDPRRRFPV